MGRSPSSSASDSSCILSESATFWNKNKGTDTLDQNNDNSTKNEEPRLDDHFLTLISFSQLVLTKDFSKSHTFHESPHIFDVFYEIILQAFLLHIIMYYYDNAPRNYIQKFTTSLLSGIVHSWWQYSKIICRYRCQRNSYI